MIIYMDHCALKIPMVFPDLNISRVLLLSLCIHVGTSIGTINITSLFTITK